jgi:hypothetical protein
MRVKAHMDPRFTLISGCLIPVFKLSVLPQSLSTESPSNDHNNTKRHQRKHVGFEVLLGTACQILGAVTE